LCIIFNLLSVLNKPSRFSLPASSTAFSLISQNYLHSAQKKWKQKEKKEDMNESPRKTGIANKEKTVAKKNVKAIEIVKQPLSHKK